MAASLTEQILARVAAVLKAGLPARTGLERYRGDAVGLSQLPCVVVRRAGTEHQESAFESDQVTTSFDLDCYTAAGEGTETAADALHIAAHAALTADAALGALGRYTLRCTGTESDTDRGETEFTRLVAHYQIDAWVLRADLTTPA